MFTKVEMQTQLTEFMIGFPSSIGRMYGSDRAGALLGHPGKNTYDISPEEAEVESTPLWQIVSAMFDYGVLGKANAYFGEGKAIDGSEADVELFLRGLDSSLEQYFCEDNINAPSLALRTVRTAVARHVLDGGERYFEQEETLAGGYCLGFSEVALLADMDERSVRNATNQKLPDPLAVVKYGKRTMVSIEEARRWLSGRKSFIATYGEEKPLPAPRAEISLPAPTVDRLRTMAAAANLTVEEFIEQRLVSAGEQQPC